MKTGLEHELYWLVGGESERGLGSGREIRARESRGSVEERVDLNDVVGPRVDRVDGIEAAGSLSADTASGGSC